MSNLFYIYIYELVNQSNFSVSLIAENYSYITKTLALIQIIAKCFNTIRSASFRRALADLIFNGDLLVREEPIKFGIQYSRAFYDWFKWL